MKFSVNTTLLQNALVKAEKGLGNGKVLPITSYFDIELAENTLFITATNLSHFITCKIDGIECDEAEAGHIIVPAEQLIKLVNKTTQPEIKFEEADNYIKVKANGEYKLPKFDEEFPNYEFDSADSKSITVQTASIQANLKVNKSSLAQDMVVPCLTGYLFNDGYLVTTDGIKICLNKFGLFDEPVLIPQSLAELLNVLDAEKTEISYADGKLYFDTPDITIFAAELEGKADYPNAQALLNTEFKQTCEIQKANLLSALDRLSVFATNEQSFGVVLNFNDSNIVATVGENTETIPFSNNKVNTENATMTVNINFLMSMIESLPSKITTINYGNDGMMEFVDGDIKELLALMTENTAEEAK